jgi:hypothetical protein
VRVAALLVLGLASLAAGCFSPRDRRAEMERVADEVNEGVLAKQHVTLRFPHVTVPDGVEFFQDLSHLNFEYEVAIADADPRLDFEVKNRPFGEALVRGLSPIGCRYEHWRGMVWITTVTPSAIPVEPEWPGPLDEALAREATVTFPRDCALKVSMGFLSGIAKIPIRVEPAVAERAVHFRARDMNLAAIIMGVARAGGVGVRVEGAGDEATIVIGEAAAVRK